MKKEIVFTLDWDFGYELESIARGNGKRTEVIVAGKPLNFMVKQTSKKIVIQFDLMDWFRSQQIKLK